MKDYRKFFTPDAQADQLAQLADIQSDMVVLEPSAGDGQIVRAIRRLKAIRVSIDAIEFDPQYVKELIHCANIVTTTDFRSYIIPSGVYDRVVANPPFGEMCTQSKSDLYQHLIKMRRCLKPSGIMVSIIPTWAKELIFGNELYMFTDGVTTFHDIENWALNSDGSKTEICIVKHHKP